MHKGDNMAHTRWMQRLAMDVWSGESRNVSQAERYECKTKQKVAAMAIDARCWVCYKAGGVSCCACLGKVAHAQCVVDWGDMMEGTTVAELCGACGQRFNCT